MKNLDEGRIRIFESQEEYIDTFAWGLVALAERSIAKLGRFSLALTGGNTPRPLYARLAMPDVRAAVDWSRVQVFFGDERTVPPDHPDSNYGMAWEAWLRHSDIAPDSIFRMAGEDGEPMAAAEEYEYAMQRHLPKGLSGFPALDLILLGMGEDGHVASLFPGTKAQSERLRLVTANHVPQKDSWRLTLTWPVIQSAGEVWMLVTGKAKAPVVASVLGQLPGYEQYPVSQVTAATGAPVWWLDRDAASEFYGG